MFEKPKVLDLSPDARNALLAKCDGKRVIVSVSGGKDSTATCLYLKELGIQYESVFMDTGWEHKDTYKFIDEVLPSIVGPITKLVYDGSEVQFPNKPELEALAQKYEARLGRWSPMVRLVIHKGMFPSRVIRFCTQYLKVEPIKKYLKGLDDHVINAVGIRAQESQARSGLAEWEWSQDYDCDIWRPIIQWSENDVIDVHKWLGIPPNPLYLRGSSRVGCWPCIFARKAEIRMLAETSPERVALIADLEQDIAKLATARYAAKNETFDSLGFKPPTWFVSRKSKPNEDGTVPLEMWPIATAVEWSNTTRSGEIEPFAPLPHEAGCMRWGLCESSWRNIPAATEERLDVLGMFGVPDATEEAWSAKMTGYAETFKEGPDTPPDEA